MLRPANGGQRRSRTPEISLASWAIDCELSQVGISIKREPYLRIVALGGESNRTSDAPTIAMVMRHELIELGVPEQTIATERRSVNTYQQLCNFQEIVTIEMLASVLIVSNRYHLGRIQAFIEHAPALLMLRKLHKFGCSCSGKPKRF